MSHASLVIANVVSRHTPLTRAFGLRRRLFVRAGVRLAPSARLCGGVTLIGTNIEVGADTWVGTGSRIIATSRASVVIGARCDIAPDVLFVVGTHDLGPMYRRAGSGASRSIVVGSGTWVGTRATFIAGASVGSGCVIAAGSVVTGTFPDNVMLGGVPAAVVRQLPVGEVTR